ncbi:MAG: hypothetical protein KDA89_20240 [Planctomycetaceae bacterium]|nr:hypothetical protein [Planctomycetaceae bacterium]
MVREADVSPETRQTQYMDAINSTRHPPLQQTSERQIAKTGTVGEIRARKRLYHATLRVAVRVASDFSRRSLTTGEIPPIHLCYIGLFSGM